MANRAAVVAVALVVGAGVYGGLIVVENRLTAGSDVPVPGEAVAANTTMHLDRIGRPTVVGQVVNGRAGPVAEATLTVQFYRDGTRIGTASDRALIPTIPAGAAAPFAVRLENQTARPDDYQVALTVEDATDRPYDGLAVTESTVADRSQTRLIVDGTVRNDGTRPAEAIVAVTFFDADGAVVGVRAVRPSPGVLPPGETAEFTVRFQTLGNVPSRAASVERFEVTAYGEPVD
jgi:hypothetical protein